MFDLIDGAGVPAGSLRVVAWLRLAGKCVVVGFGLSFGLMAGPAWAQAQGDGRFDILEYRIEGNSLLAASEVELAVTPHLGEALSLQDVEAARTALEKRYHDAGFLTVLVTIPEQQVDGGVVALLVTEASVSRLRVAGAQYHLPSAIRERMPPVAEGTVPNFTALQQSLGEINRSADLKVTPVLKPGRTPGTVDVQLDVDDQLPLHGQVDVSNRQSANTTATRLGASLRYDNLWQRGHSLGLTLQTSPEAPEQTQLLSLNYLWPMGPNGTALTLYAVTSRSEFATLYNAPGLGVLGNNDILGLRYAMPLGDALGYAQTLSLGLDIKKNLQSLRFAGVDTPSPAVTYAPLTLAYRGVWLNDQPQPSTLDISATLGLRGLLGNEDAAFGVKRSGASANYSALRSTLQLYRAMARWQWGAKLEWQAASGPLLPSEQFSAGGADSVRGFLEGERAGDQAVRLSFELTSPSVKLPLGKGDWRMTGLAFLDEALLNTHQAGVGQAGDTALAGAGVGMRLTGPAGLGVQFDAARALTDGDVAGGGTRRGDWRLHGRVSLEF